MLKVILISFIFLSCSKQNNKQTNINSFFSNSKSTHPKTDQNLTQLEKKSEIETTLEKGKKIFLYRCASCHQNEGEGIKGVYPPLANSDWLKKDVKTQAISSVKNGKKGLITVNGISYNGVMPALPLLDIEIAQVLTYIYKSLNHLEVVVTESEVKAVNSKTFSGK